MNKSIFLTIVSLFSAASSFASSSTVTVAEVYYSNTSNEQKLEEGDFVTFNNQKSDVDPSPISFMLEDSQITIVEPGIYNVTFTVYVGSNKTTDVVFTVDKNGEAEISGAATIYKKFDIVVIVNEELLDFQMGDVVKLRLSSISNSSAKVSVPAGLDSATTAMISFVKLADEN